MFRLIDNLPPDVLGIEAVGKVTHEDYLDVLIPAAEAKMRAGPIRMLYVAGAEFERYELEALWDDGTFGMKHWHDFRRVAVVTDTAWMRASVTVFRPIFPCEVRLFRVEELQAAKDWIVAP